MKYFSNTLEDSTLVWIIFREEDNKQAFLNYLGSFSSDYRYQGVIVEMSKYHYFKGGYNYVYSNRLPVQVVENYIKLMEDN